MIKTGSRHICLLLLATMVLNGAAGIGRSYFPFGSSRALSTVIVDVRDCAETVFHSDPLHLKLKKMIDSFRAAAGLDPQIEQNDDTDFFRFPDQIFLTSTDQQATGSEKWAGIAIPRFPFKTRIVPPPLPPPRLA